MIGNDSVCLEWGQVDMQSLVEAKAGPISVFTAYCNTDTSKKTSAMRSALELAGIRIMAVDVRRLIASPGPHK
jgi:hypothetical protein